MYKNVIVTSMNKLIPYIHRWRSLYLDDAGYMDCMLLLIQRFSQLEASLLQELAV